MVVLSKRIRFIDQKESVNDIRATFKNVYSLDSSSDGLRARKLAFSHSEHYVLKPQREGGGNNIYRSSIPRFLESLPDESYYNAYILMELIRTPRVVNSFVREGKVVTGEVVGELGVYGTILWDNCGKVHMNEEAGWILRTKRSGCDEGGVTSGFGCEDSVCLV
jgi:glutathione synthase